MRGFFVSAAPGSRRAVACKETRGPAENASLFSTFPMFVPSLSW